MQLIAIDPSALDALRREIADLKDEIRKVRITPEPEWLTVKEYAAKINRSEDTVRRKVAAGEVETKHVGGVRMIRV